MMPPAVFGLLAASTGASILGGYATRTAFRILRHWNPASGSSRQIRMENEVYLATVIIRMAAVIQFFSFFYFIAAADRLHTVLTGAMCAAGVLNANVYGYPALLLKLAVVILAGLWLILDNADQQGWDQPLIRPKFSLLPVIAALMMLDTAAEWAFFFNIRPDVITTCCGVLFNADASGLSGNMAGLPASPTAFLFFSSIGLHLLFGVLVIFFGRFHIFFGVLSGWLLPLSVLSIFSFISVYYYELPTHHCPFCILQKEYHFIGYPIYFSILLGCISGLGVGILHPFRLHPTLRETVPLLQKKLCLAAVIGYLFLGGMAAYPMIFSDFIL